VSPGCTYCYADGLSKRWGYAIWGPPEHTSRRLFGERHWGQPIAWDAQAEKAGERRTVFPSMCDPFELHPQLTPERDRLWTLIRATPNLDWLLLTKRPENIGALMPPGWWPNVWLGTSTENQDYADLRIPQLLAHRAQVPVLFLSVEPQIGEVDLAEWLDPHGLQATGYPPCTCIKLDWIITGGESGARHRPFDIGWARLTRDQCRSAGVAWHFKQHGGRTHAEGGCLLDGEETKEFPRRRLIAA